MKWVDRFIDWAGDRQLLSQREKDGTDHPNQRGRKSF
jgi:hypothetical protein